MSVDNSLVESQAHYFEDGGEGSAFDSLLSSSKVRQRTMTMSASSLEAKKLPANFEKTILEMEFLLDKFGRTQPQSLTVSGSALSLPETITKLV